MSVTRKARVLMSERQSGLTDTDWCRENSITVSTFYNFNRCRKTATDQTLQPNYGHLENLRPRQDVVPINLVPDSFPEQHASSQMLELYLDNSHTIEIAVKDITIRLHNGADLGVIPGLNKIYIVCGLYS